MGWKNWPYWLKGGIIATLIYIIVSVYTLPQLNLPTPLGIKQLLGLILFPSYLVYFIIGAFIRVTSTTIILIDIISIPLYFIIGAIIGLIYGKIKKKN